MSISKDTKLRVTIALTSESAAEELLEAIQEGSNDDLADNFAKKDLSNLTATSIPAGVNLESTSTSVLVSDSFKIKTKDQTASVSGRIELRSGAVSGNFSSGTTIVSSGDSSNASGGGNKTGPVQVLSGTISSGTQGSTGSILTGSGNLFFALPTTYGFGSTGFTNLLSGSITFQQGGTLTSGSTGSCNIRSGDVNDFSGLGVNTLVANTGFVDIKSGENSASGISGNIRIRSGSNKNPNSTLFGGVSGYLIANTGKSLNGQSGSLHLYTGSVSAGKMQIPIWGAYNEEPTFDNSAGLKGTGHISVSTGYIENPSNTIETGRMVLKTGYTLGTGNSGNFDIETGNVVSGTSGSISLKTGTGNPSGRGSVKVSSKYLELNDSTRMVLNSSNGDNVLARLQISDNVGQYGHLFFNRFLPSSEIYIGAMESAINHNGAPVRFSGAWSMSDVDGVYKGSDVYLQSRSYGNVLNAPNVSLDSGDIFIETENAYVQGSYTDANSGNINLTTGNKQGSGTRGNIELNAKGVRVNVDYYNGLIVTNPSGVAWVNISSTGFGTPDNPEISLNGVASGGQAAIQAFSRMNNSGGATFLKSTMVSADADGDYNGGDLNLIAGSNTFGGVTASNASVSSGNVNIETANAYITGSSVNANTGNISLTTGTPQGSGTRGKITLDARVIDHNKVPSTNFVVENGLTGSRPASPVVGQMYFDTTLNKPIWYAGAGWVDALGASV